MPPNGNSGEDATIAFAKTMPASTPAIAWSISRESRAQIEPPSPHGVLFATAIASLRSLTTCTTARVQRAPRTRGRILGHVGEHGRWIIKALTTGSTPPQRNVAPWARTSPLVGRSGHAVRRSRGPTTVFSSIGSPTMAAAMPATKASTNSSARSRTTMKRFAAMQLCPFSGFVQ